MNHPGDAAARIERRWAGLSAGIVALLVLIAAYAGIHQAVMPQVQVETADPTTLHLTGEFIESNLGTALEPDGTVTLRAIGQQYSFTPQCILLPTDTDITLRATSADVMHGFLIQGSNVNTMLVPGYVSTVTTRFRHAVRPRDALPRILRRRARGHVGPGPGDRQISLPEACRGPAEVKLCCRIAA